MNFADRAVQMCVRDMEAGMSDELHVQDVLKCKKVDVSPIEKFLISSCASVRWSAARIIGEKGNVGLLLKVAQAEDDPFILAAIMKLLGKRKTEGIEVLARLLESEDFRLKEAAIQMFRDAERTDPLFPLLFDSDDVMVHRIKRYLNEQEQSGKTPHI